MPTPQDPNAGPTLGGAGANTATTTNIASENSNPATLNPATGQPDPYNQNPASPETPTTSTTQSVSFDPVLRSAEQIQSNPFDGYIDVTYNISLAMISWSAAESLRGGDGGDVGAGDYVVLASTAEQVTDKTRWKGDYYNIKSYVFTSFVGHLPQNPMAAISWDAKMKIIQPYGFSLREDLDSLARQLGYKIANPLNFVYRIEIWFSGYKPTGEWVRRLPFSINDNRPSSTNSVVYYSAITTCEARVTASGTVYDLSLQTVSHLATRAETIVMHHDQHGAIGKVGVGYEAGNKFRDFIKNLIVALHNQVFFDTQGYLNVEYEFLGPDWLFDATFSANGKIDFSSGVTYNDDTGSYSFSGNNVDIYTLLNHVMNALPLVRKLHLREDDPEFVKPGCTWNIRTNIARVADPNHVIAGYRAYKFQYFIEPVLSFRSRMTEVPQRNIRVSPANQRARAEEMRRSGMLVRRYDYFFSGTNSEVIDFQFTFKNFYYESYPYSDVENEAPVLGHNTSNTSYQKQFSENQEENANFNFDTGIGIPSYVLQASGSGSDLSEVLGIPSSPQSAIGSADPPTIHQGLNRTPVHPASQNLGTSQAKTQKYLKSKHQYLSYDMINAQLTVRFDPVWLLNPYMAGRDFTSTLPTDQGDGAIYVHTDRVVFIKAHRPNQKNYMNPDFANTSPNRSPILGGFYQVIYAINEFQEGRFVQKLNMFKYPHLNYFNSLPGENNDSTIRQSDTSEISFDAYATASSGDAQDPTTSNPLGG